MQTYGSKYWQEVANQKTKDLRKTNNIYQNSTKYSFPSIERINCSTVQLNRKKLDSMKDKQLKSKSQMLRNGSIKEPSAISQDQYKGNNVFENKISFPFIHPDKKKRQTQFQKIKQFPLKIKFSGMDSIIGEKVLSSKRIYKQQIDKRKQIIQPRQYPYSAIVYISANKGLKSHFFGTGGLVSRNLVLTAANNVRLTKRQRKENQDDFDQKKYKQKEIFVYFGVNGQIQDAARKIKVSQIYFPRQFQIIDDFKSFDYALLRLDTQEDLTLQFGCFGVDPQWSCVQIQVNIFGYPYDKIQQKVTRENLSIGNGNQYGFLFGETRQIFEISHSKKILRYNEISTSRGQSGSPIYIQSGGLFYIVGIHIGKEYSGQYSFNFGVKISQEIVGNLEKMVFRFQQKARKIDPNYHFIKLQTQLLNLAKNNGWNDIIERVQIGKKNIDSIKKVNFGCGKQLKDIEKLKVLKGLEELWLNDNQIEEIDDFKIFPKLKKLWLHNNKISRIQNLSMPNSLEQLWLQKNNIKQIINLSKLTSLKLLSLKQNNIEKIKSLSKLTQLKKLYLSSNKIQKIQNLDKQTKLQWLFLDNNKIRRIEKIDHLTHLQILSLRKNSILKIQKISGLQSLKKLYLQHNKVSEIKNIENSLLQELWLGNNQIKEIKNLQQLQSLKKLDLSSNQITKLQNIQNLPSLEYLEIKWVIQQQKTLNIGVQYHNQKEKQMFNYDLWLSINNHLQHIIQQFSKQAIFYYLSHYNKKPYDNKYLENIQEYVDAN